MPRYLRPLHTEEALAALADSRWTPLAGGTDFYPARVGHEIIDDVLDLSGLRALRGIEEASDHWRIGALTTWTDVARAQLPRALGALQGAAREIGGAQIQNAGTVGGNLCNASPAADGVAALMALDAGVELRSLRGTRTLPLTEFVVGNRQTERTPDELLTAVLVPGPVGEARSTFLKLGGRRYLVISIVMVSVLLEWDEERRIVRAAVAVGACSAVAQRLRALEHALVGLPLSDAPSRVRREHLDGLRPLDDVRGQAAFRMEAAHQLVLEGLREVSE